MSADLAYPALGHPELGHPVLDMHVHTVIARTWTTGTQDYVREANPEAYADSASFEDPAHLWGILAGEGVDHAVVLAEEAPASSGMVTSEFIQDYCADIPTLHPFASLNPAIDEDLVGRLERLLARGRVAGLKFLPPYQHVYPNDPRLYPLYERAEALGLPCTFHTGLSRIPGTRLKFADPLLLDDVAVDFPHLPILLAHAGRGVWYDAAAMLATLHENVYLELSGLPPRNLPRYFPQLERLVGKMIFGSDFPGVPSIAENIAALREVLGEAGARAVLWENGARLLGLKE
ncbi:MAG: amidohydrolase family protein [Actinobacteria bacterium]|nr:amidohydrolase family protein [Actinomycetota bacterium]